MADIFISYARADRDKIEKLAAALEAQGYSVWWDRDIQGGAQFAAEIGHELEEAKTVIVAWSERSQQSEWVLDEAGQARDDAKLVPICIDDTLPPLGFRQRQAVDFSRWDGAQDAAEITALKAAIDQVKTGGTGVAAPVRRAAAQKPAFIIAAGIAVAVCVVTILALIVLRGGDSATIAQSQQTQAASEYSIAVLPFEALSNDESDGYFGKGLAEELLNRLASIQNLEVAARTSAFSFEGQNLDLREVGRQLGVAHVLEGSVRRSNDRVRVTAQLIRASDGFHLWSKTYEKNAEDVFAIEDEIARDITRSLEARLGVGFAAGRSSGDDVDSAAYEQYLKGLVLWGERGQRMENRAEALNAFQTAARLDPDFADAWAMTGFVVGRSTPDSLGMTPEVFNAYAERAFETALSLDPENFHAHIGLSYFRRDLTQINQARYHTGRAREIAPNHADTYYTSGVQSFFEGDHEQALADLNSAVALDPLNLTLRRVRAYFLAQAGKFGEAFDFLDECFSTQCIRDDNLLLTTTFSAIYSRDERWIEMWLPRFELVEQGDMQLPESERSPDWLPASAAISIALEKDDKEQQIEKITARFETDPILFNIGLWGPLVAGDLPPDLFFAAIEDAAETGELLRGPHSLFFLHEIAPMPEAILRNPRYHALWERPGLAELAAARRANGKTAGLPLPINEDGS